MANSGWRVNTPSITFSLITPNPMENRDRLTSLNQTQTRPSHHPINPEHNHPIPNISKPNTCLVFIYTLIIKDQMLITIFFRGQRYINTQIHKPGLYKALLWHKCKPWMQAVGDCVLTCVIVGIKYRDLKYILEVWNLNQQQRTPDWAQTAITCLNPSY
jgi:hypothetical protein